MSSNRYSTRGLCPAFDYSAQKWVLGVEGQKLAIAQTKQQLATLTGPTGKAFFAHAKANGLTCQSPDVWAMVLRDEITELESVLARVLATGK